MTATGTAEAVTTATGTTDAVTPDAGTTGPRARETVRRWRLPVTLALLVLAGGAVIALLQPSAGTGSLDPDSTASGGGHALADLVAARGQHVIRQNAGTAPPAANAGGSAAGGSAGTELVPGADQLSGAQLARAARFPGDIIVTDPDPAALRVLAPAVTTTAGSAGPGGPAGSAGPGVAAAPLCNDPAANLAGSVDAAGAVLQTTDPAAAACYPGAGGYFLVRYAGTYQGRKRTITVLGGDAPFTNDGLAGDGDASLALNLLNQPSITWLVPVPGTVPAGQAQGQRSFASLVPWPAWLVAIQLAIAAGLAAAWRARRLGALVPEKIPVVVRASETVEGHGRLYQARRARDRAAAELRNAARARIAARTGQPPGSVTGPALDGPAPASDTELVALADDLDSLERKARHP
jgi:hypothetical protein